MITTLLEKLKALECSLHGARRQERAWLEEILHPEFREITRSGVSVDREETISSLAGEKHRSVITSSDFRLICLTTDSAILHYRTVNPENGLASLRSSCWARSDGDRWQLVFHQGTPEAG